MDQFLERVMGGIVTPIEQKQMARQFVERWQTAEGNEQREANSYWIELVELLGVSNPTRVLDFERKVQGRRIDVFYEDMGILIESKSRGVDLDKQYQRGKDDGGDKRMVTPYEQAKWYADNMPHSIRPRWVIVCNFDEIRIHDLDLENPGSDYVSILLEELPQQVHLLSFFVDSSCSRLVREKELSVKAGELVGRLYDEFSKQYKNLADNPIEQRSLNVLIVRLVFLLYAEDAGLMSQHQAFLEYMKKFDASQSRQALIDLFKVLDTPDGSGGTKDERDPYLPENLAAFPYVNGGLFSDEGIIIPQFTDDIRVDLLVESSMKFDWSGISPTIFGAAFESTLNPETRRAGGMHYTSIENIHKVIDPLFLEDLKAELAELEGEKVEKKRFVKLRMFQKKLSELTFLDPAAGSHNFLTETYLSLRKLEMRIIEDLQGNQTSFIDNPILVNIGQFYAIEINEFAVAVGKTALWIAEQQMMEQTQELLPYQEFDFLPLKSITNSHCGNALRMDWNEVLPAEKCSFVIGNPPFYGSSMCSPEQKQEIVDLYGKIKLSNSLDYVSGWYYKACAQISKNDAIRAAFVSTNSITQGEQVYPIWNTLFNRFAVHLDFAWNTFIWDSEASSKAHVHCVIIGFSMSGCERRLYCAETGESKTVENVSPYLRNLPSILVASRARPLCPGHQKMKNGSKPTDGGWYLFTPEEKKSFIASEPSSEKFFRPWVGSEEFINRKERWCLYLRDTDQAELAAMPLVMRRVEAVRDVRLGMGPNSKGKMASKKPPAPTVKSAETPTRFFCDNVQKESYLIIPKVSSERRDYVPIGFMPPNAIASDLVATVEQATIYDFGVLASQTHNAWMRVVCGRMKSDYRYTPGLVYNTFPWPSPTPEQEAAIEGCAQAVLDVRDLFPDKSLADLYDPDKMPAVLLEAHHALDAAVEAAYGVDFGGDEEKIVAHLFKLYAELTDGE